MRCCTRQFMLITALGLLMLGAWSVVGQSLADRGLRPVDPRVEDVGALGTSLRRIPAGLAADGGEFQNVFTPTDAKNDRQLYWIQPGLVAKFDQSDYRWTKVKVDGRKVRALAPFVPPGTVFQLGLPTVQPPTPKPVELVDDPRLNQRIGQPQGRPIDRRLTDQPTPRSGRFVQPEKHDPKSQAYLQWRRQIRRRVVQAIDPTTTHRANHSPD